MQASSLVLVKGPPDADTDARAGGKRWLDYARRQWEMVHVRLVLVQLVVGLIPYGLLGNVRGLLYCWAGFSRIEPQVYILGRLDVRGDGPLARRLRIGRESCINAPCLLELNAAITVGERVDIGHHAVIITSTHELGPAARRCGPRTSAPVEIGDGAWLGANVTVLPGVTIGAGAVISAGSVVTKDVPPNAKVAGNPARVIGWLDE